MNIFFLIVGAFVAASLWHTGIAGFLFGGALGWLLWRVHTLDSDVKVLQEQLVNKTSDILEKQTLQEPETQALQNHAVPSAPQGDSIEVGRAASPYAVSQKAVASKSVVRPEANKKKASTTDNAESWGQDDAWVSFISEKISWLLTWFVSGNTLVRVGSVVLFFGAGFLLKYAAEHSQLSIEIRMMGVASLAFVMLAVGWYLRASREIYALALLGGGLGLLYLTIFASFRLFDLLPATVALALLAVVSGVGVTLSVMFNARWLAILSFAGGFLAPILASTGTGSHVALFSWYAVLNVGIAVLAWFKAWRILNLLGMLATFIIVTLWGSQYYQEAYFDSVEPFLIAFGILYLAIGVVFSLHRADPEQEGFGRVDASIIFGTPVGFFLLQTPLVHHFEHGMSLSALISGLVYLCVAWLAYKQQNKTLMIALLSIGGTLLTLAIPLEFDEAETAAVWAMEGVGLLWLGLTQKSSRALLTGFALQALSAGSWLWGYGLQSSDSFGSSLSAFLIALSGWGCAILLDKHESWRKHHGKAKTFIPLEINFGLQVWGVAVWVIAGLTELDRHFDGYDMFLSGLIWLGISAWWSYFLGLRLNWVKLRGMNQWLIVLCWLGLLMQGEYAAHPTEGWGAIVWLFFLATTGWMLYQFDGRYERKENHIKFSPVHIAVACFIPVFLIYDMRWYVEDWFALAVSLELWKDLTVGIILALLLMVISTQANHWPIRKEKESYIVVSAAIYITVLVVWLLWMLKEPVDIGLPYMPVFNPLDIVLILIGLGVYKWLEALKDNGLLWFDKHVFYAVAGLVVFVWLNSDIARVVHHYFAVPWRESTMFHAVEFQAALSLSWSILALVIMLMSVRYKQRNVWMVGAILLAIVFIKLFTVDMSGSGTLARIVSFLGVGGLFLVIGYFVPIPPASKSELEIKTKEDKN